MSTCILSPGLIVTRPDTRLSPNPASPHSSSSILVEPAALAPPKLKMRKRAGTKAFTRAKFFLAMVNVGDYADYGDGGGRVA